MLLDHTASLHRVMNKIWGEYDSTKDAKDAQKLTSTSVLAQRSTSRTYDRNKEVAKFEGSGGSVGEGMSSKDKGDDMGALAEELNRATRESERLTGLLSMLPEGDRTKKKCEDKLNELEGKKADIRGSW